MDFDHLCTPMRGHDMSEMGHVAADVLVTIPSTLPGATAAYIAKVKAQVEALKDKLSTETRALELASEGYMRVIGERDRAKARVAEIETELAGWRDGVFVHPDHAATAPSAFLWYIEKLERRIAVLEGERDDMRQPLGEVADQRDIATARAFSAPALMSGPYMGDD